MEKKILLTEEIGDYKKVIYTRGVDLFYINPENKETDFILNINSTYLVQGRYCICEVGEGHYTYDILFIDGKIKLISDTIFDSCDDNNILDGFITYKVSGDYDYTQFYNLLIEKEGEEEVSKIEQKEGEEEVSKIEQKDLEKTFGKELNNKNSNNKKFVKF